MIILGGIQFELREELNKSSPTPTVISYIHLQVRITLHIQQRTHIGNHFLTSCQSIPLSLRAMFDQYFQLGHRLRKHYLSPQVIFCLVTGRFVPPIHRRNLYSMQYSMLPARRAGMAEVWAQLTEKKSSGANSTSGPVVGLGGVGNGLLKVPNGFGGGVGRRR